MALSPTERPAGGMDLRTRLLLLGQAAVAALLAVAAAFLATWVSERAARVRFDLTSDAENTLDPQTEGVLRALPAEVQVDVFFSAPEPPFQVVGLEVQARMLRLLRLAADQSAGRLALVRHDLSDRARISESTQARRLELGLQFIEPGGVVAVSCGGRRQVLHLRGDLADLDPGNADARVGPVVPARVVHFRGEEALLDAVLKVSEDRSPKVVFTRGHGELDTALQSERGALLFARELEAQGFELSTWDGTRGATLPEGADVVVLLGPEQRLTDGEFAQVAAFVERGGRALVALPPSGGGGQHGAVELLARFGIAARADGIVCAPVPAFTGQLQVGIPECALLSVGYEGMPAQNTITNPLRLARLGVVLFAARPLERGAPPPGGRVVDLLRAPPEAWLELAGPDGAVDYAPEPASQRGSFSVAAQAAFPPLSREQGPRPQGADARAEARVVAIGSADALANHLFANNRDFVVNCFDWLSSREYRVRVAPRSTQARRLDLSQPETIARVSLVSVVLLPGACLLVGAWVAWRRRRT